MGGQGFRGPQRRQGYNEGRESEGTWCEAESGQIKSRGLASFCVDEDKEQRGAIHQRTIRYQGEGEYLQTGVAAGIGLEGGQVDTESEVKTLLFMDIGLVL